LALVFALLAAFVVALFNIAASAALLAAPAAEVGCGALKGASFFCNHVGGIW
jgi:hypothetical protein